MWTPHQYGHFLPQGIYWNPYPDDIVCTAQTKPVGEDFQSTALQSTGDDNDKSLMDI